MLNSTRSLFGWGLQCMALSVCLFLAACAALEPGAEARVPRAASEAFARARHLRASGAVFDDPAMWQALAEARALAHDWVAPRRFEDDLLTAAGRGPEALNRHRIELSTAPRDARLVYLMARLEGAEATRRFAQAAALEPSFAWGQHGNSWSLGRQGEQGPALHHARRALHLARDDWERAFFALALARRLRTFKQEPEALRGLRAALDEASEMAAADRAWFSAEVALFELRSNVAAEVRKGYARGLELIRTGAPSAAALRGLVAEMFTRGAGFDLRKYELELALASQDSNLRRELRATGFLRRTPLALAMRLFERDVSMPAGNQDRSLAVELSRSEAFGRGLYREALEAWLAELPQQVRDAEDQLPRRAVLREVVLATRALDSPPTLAELQHLGECLLAAGWFSEAFGLVGPLAELDLDVALTLRERSIAGRVLFEGLTTALLDVERGSEDLAASVSLCTASEQRDEAGSTDDVTASSKSGLDDLLMRWAALFARSAEWLGGETSAESSVRVLLGSPRLKYGPFASVVHPGSRFSPADEEAGLGCGGDPVPGLAPLLERYGRFAIIGQVLGGGGPDGTVLRLLALEEREGEHLGVAWRGTIAWCEGTDLLSRAGRQGARIAGAALHEGYWIDINAVRHELGRWRDLRARFSGEGAEARIAAALGVRGLALMAPSAQVQQRRWERLKVTPLLGEGDRVRLAIMRDRWLGMRDRALGSSGSAPLAEMSLTELAAAVARHEEGHLCDRTRFFPINEHLGAIFRFALANGFSARAIQERLEYRAHLTALCVTNDARVPLVELLDTSDTSLSGGLPHGAAYAKLLSDLLGVLDRKLDHAPEAWPELDPNRTLVHQLHLLSSDQIRNLAQALARRRGLVD